MNSIDRERRFREAQDALVHTIRTVIRTQKADPLAVTFILVHRTSKNVYRQLLEHGGSPAGDGFAIGVGQRSSLPSDPLVGLAVDQIACMISIDDHHKALGLPLDVLGDEMGGEA